MSPAEKALAIAFNAWVEWPGQPESGETVLVMRDLGEVWKARGLALWDGCECLPTDAGRDLLDRARKAGVLP